MGIEPFLVASSVNLVLAQRLVRRVCQACKRQVEPSSTEVIQELGLGLEGRGDLRMDEGGGLRGVQQHRIQGPPGSTR